MNFSLKFYWSLVLRRLPVMTAIILVCSVVAVIAALKLPPTYSTAARLLVEAPQIPDNMVASTIQTDASEQLQVIEQQLMTRANLIDIANKFEVFEDLRSLSPDRVVKSMRERTRIYRSSGRGQATLMTLSFEADSGQVAANVVNEYVTLILEANSKFRMTRAENTLAFFEQEVERLGADLDLQSGKIIQFKNQNADALPDDLAYRQGRQALLQERLARLERERAGTQSQRNEIITVFEATGRVDAEAQGRAPTLQEQQLALLEAELQEKLAVLSETNPKVVLLKSRIAQLQEAIKQAAPAAVQGASVRPASLLDVTLAEMDQRLQTMGLEIAEVSAELSELEASIAATSGNGIALSSLERDYDNIQARYNAAVNNLNQARMSERIEVSSQGQRISIIEGATVPQEPSGPNRPKIAAAGIGGGLALAAGFFMLLELLNRTIRRPAELQARFGIMPIATIPYMESAQERFRRRALLVGAFLLVLIGVPAILYYIDVNYMPLEILAHKVFDRLGLS
jgi:polysaccharide chain length determinant protein (PEP-CTERM system associated)